MRLTLHTGFETKTIISFGDSAFSELNELLLPSDETIFLLTDKVIREACFNILVEKVPRLGQAVILEIPSGEKNKTLFHAQRLWNELLTHGASRRSFLVNLGGGVVTDTGGFVASTYKRGIPCIHIPTTLLGMVDAAIGGKTAVNLGPVKNQIGSFYSPAAIIVHPVFLKTLDAEEMRSGFGEVLKTALIGDARLWTRLLSVNLNDLFRTGSGTMAVEEIISECVAIKCRYVENDFLDKHEREILNFGHTIGHALESLSIERGKNELSHGHAVAMGMIVETQLSVSNAGLDPDIRDSIVSKILNEFRYIPMKQDDRTLLQEFMRHDKKAKNHEQIFSLIRSPGEPVRGIRCSLQEIEAAFDYYQSLG
jgi:3-dehydroquinate synthase